MRKFVKTGLHVFHAIKPRHNTFCIKGLKNIFFFCALLFSQISEAQTPFNCPSARRCTSNDLEIVGAFLTAGTCYCSGSGSQTATLNLSIINKTGSLRTSFAFFGTLRRSGGADELISRCGGPLPPNSTTTIQVGNITYTCSQTLSLNDVFLAWTDAAGSTIPRCDEILLDACKSIAPKCGTAAVIPINPLLSLTTSTVDGCTGRSDGKITINPIGGQSPYTVTLKQGTTTVATQSNVTTSGHEFTGLAEGTYTASVTDAATVPCTYSTSVILSSQFCCVAPTIETQPSPETKCAGLNASFTSTATGGDPIPTVQWQEKVGSGNFTSLSNVGKYSGSTSTTLTITGVTTTMSGNQYRAVFTSSGCAPTNSNAALLTVNAIPGTPGVSVVNNCDGSSDLTATNYTGSLLWSNNATSASIHVTNAATYTVTQTILGCTSAAGSGTSAPKTTPGKPSVAYNSPACDANTFSVTVSSVSPNATYTIVNKNGGNISGVSPGNSHTPDNNQNFDFSNIPAGSGFKVIVTANGCPSEEEKCGTPTQLADPVLRMEAIKVDIGAQTSVLAAPNPFNDRVRFSLHSEISGHGSLELYNMVGQKVKSVYQGYISKGEVKTLEYSVPGTQRSNLIYIFKVGDQRTTGKLIGLR